MSLFSLRLCPSWTRRYAQKCGWKINLLSYTEAETGGYKEVIAQVNSPALLVQVVTSICI